ncbi:MAG: hypothetical protein H6970_03570 [Gammaproteobacteria bacterium]|nr:hypothetical protein [Gammaproteobacteria bacterium]
MAPLRQTDPEAMPSLSTSIADPARDDVPFEVAYVAADERARVLADDTVFAVIEFADRHGLDEADHRRFTIGLPEAEGAKVHALEVWRSHKPVTYDYVDGITLARNEDMLFARLLLEESRYTDLDAATFDAYQRIGRLTRNLNYPHMLRTWNYFPGINDPQNGLERYRAFSQGRYRALVNVNPEFETTLPAACAIGTRAPGLLIYFLAAKTPGIQIENPRQVSAFRYPPQYGPRSPSFSRAVLKRWTGASHLFISGTASIVGHVSRHPRDPLAQLDETLANLEALLNHANRFLQASIRLASIKLYLRPDLRAADVQQRLDERLGRDLPRLLLTGDICRDDLLLEIEGLGVSP